MLNQHRVLASSRLLWTVEQDRKRKIHEQRLLEIGKRRPRSKRKNKNKKLKGLQANGIDCHIDKSSYKHILENKKKQYMKEREAIEVKRINRLLLGKLQKVFASDSPFDEIEPQYIKPRSLNINERRKELMRINNENKAMLRRLESVEPTMSARQLADEDKIRRRDRKRLQNFIPTVDIYVHSQSIAESTVPVPLPTATTTTTAKVPAPPKPNSTRPKRNKPHAKGRTITNSVLEETAPPSDALAPSTVAAPSVNALKEQELQKTTLLITQFIESVAGKGATTMLYKQFLAGLMFDANIRTQWNQMARPITAKQCALLYDSTCDTLSFKDVLPWMQVYDFFKEGNTVQTSNMT